MPLAIAYSYNPILNGASHSDNPFFIYYWYTDAFFTRLRTVAKHRSTPSKPYSFTWIFHIIYLLLILRPFELYRWASPFSLSEYGAD